MAGYISGDTRKVTTHRLVEMKQRGEKISMLTSYDYTTAQIVDGAGIDVILVGDSASNVMAGNVTTLPITLDQMIYHGKVCGSWGETRACCGRSAFRHLPDFRIRSGDQCDQSDEDHARRCIEAGRWRGDH